MKKILKLIALLLFVSASIFFYYRLQATPLIDPVIEETKINEDGYYTSKDDVALYLVTYHHLPDNYITKNEAKKLGWDGEKGNLWQVSDQKSIGGDKFANREKILPEDDEYFECDIDYQGGARNGKRIVYCIHYDVYYTDDHYQSFELLYEGE